MFEKYREKKIERDFMGMSKGEFIRLCAMLVMMLIVLIFLFLVLPGYIADAGKPKDFVPTDKAKIAIPEEIPERIEDDDATKKYGKFLNEKLRTGKDIGGGETGGTISSDILPPKPPSPKEPFKENPDIWNKVVDKTESPPLEVQVYIFHMLNSMPAEEIEKRAEAIHLGESYSAITANTKEYRGKFVHIGGRLISLENRTMQDNVSGVTQFWFGRLYRTDDPRTVLFFIFEKDREFEADPYKGDDVEISGVFVMMLEAVYEDKGREKRMVEPFIIARRIRHIPPAPMFTSPSWIVLFALAGTLLAVILLLVIKGKRELKESEQFLSNIRAKLLEAAKSKAKKSEEQPTEQKPAESNEASPQQQQTSPPPCSCCSQPQKPQETEEPPKTDAQKDSKNETEHKE